jgi:hypothetical protein
MVDLDAIEARANAATEGPWNDLGENGITQTAHVTRDVWTIPVSVEDVTFIAHARTDIPALISEVRRLQAFMEPAEGVDPEEVIREDAALHGKSVSATMLLPLAVRAPRLARALIAERATSAKLRQDLEDARRMYREDMGREDCDDEDTGEPSDGSPEERFPSPPSWAGMVWDVEEGQDLAPVPFDIPLVVLHRSIAPNRTGLRAEDGTLYLHPEFLPVELGCWTMRLQIEGGNPVFVAGCPTREALLKMVNHRHPDPT